MKNPVLGSNLTQSFIDFETTQGKLRFGKEGLKLFIELSGQKIFLTEDGGLVDLGAAATPVVRTNNPIVGANKPNLNIDLLDAAIGANLSPAGTRTAGSVAVANTVNQNLDALDAALGFENQMSGTPNTVTKSGTIFQMLDQLDTFKSVRTIKKRIGGVGVKSVGTILVSDTPIAEQTMNIGAVTYTFKALRVGAGEITIDANTATQVTNIVTAITADSSDVVAEDGAGDSVVVTAVIVGDAGNLLDFYTNATGIAMDGVENMGGTTSGADPVPGSDFNFAPDANQNDQVIDLGEIIPPYARIVDCFVKTDNTFTGAVSLATEVGVTSSGHELVGAVDIITANTVNAMAADHSMTVAPTLAPKHVYVAAIPGANWNLVTAGKMTIYITIIDVTNM